MILLPLRCGLLPEQAEAQRREQGDSVGEQLRRAADAHEQIIDGVVDDGDAEQAEQTRRAERAAAPHGAQDAAVHAAADDVHRARTEAADEQNIPWDYDVAPAHTGTDAWDTQIQMGGVATGLISLPLRYMHTSVEEISLTTLKNCAKVIARFAQNIGADWEEKLCLDD